MDLTLNRIKELETNVIELTRELAHQKDLNDTIIKEIQRINCSLGRHDKTTQSSEEARDKYGKLYAIIEYCASCKDGDSEFSANE